MMFLDRQDVAELLPIADCIAAVERAFAEGIFWFFAMVWAVDRSRRFFLGPRVRRRLDAVHGGLLIALGLRLAFART